MKLKNWMIVVSIPLICFSIVYSSIHSKIFREIIRNNLPIITNIVGVIGIFIILKLLLMIAREW